MIHAQALLNPIISEDHVRKALDALLYTAAARVPNPLEALCLVDARLDEPFQPQSPLIRRYALGQLLTEIITDRLRASRAALKLALPQLDETLDQALYHIALDGQTRNIELISWSWLHYRYVRIDLGITRHSFRTQIASDERTLRRYQSHGIRRLTERLIALEYAARRDDARFAS